MMMIILKEWLNMNFSDIERVMFPGKSYKYQGRYIHDDFCVIDLFSISNSLFPDWSLMLKEKRPFMTQVMAPFGIQDSGITITCQDGIRHRVFSVSETGGVVILEKYWNLITQLQKIQFTHDGFVEITDLMYEEKGVVMYIRATTITGLNQILRDSFYGFGHPKINYLESNPLAESPRYEYGSHGSVLPKDKGYFIKSENYTRHGFK